MAVEDPLLAFVREYAEQRLLCLFNLSGDLVKYDLSVHGEYLPETNLGFDFQLWQDTLELPNYGVFFANLNSEE